MRVTTTSRHSDAHHGYHRDVSQHSRGSFHGEAYDGPIGGAVLRAEDVAALAGVRDERPAVAGLQVLWKSANKKSMINLLKRNTLFGEKASEEVLTYGTHQE